MNPPKPIRNQRIVAVRPMNADELAAEMWEYGPYDIPIALVLENGVVLYPSRDAAGNGPGVLFQREGADQAYVLTP